MKLNFYVIVNGNWIGICENIYRENYTVNFKCEFKYFPKIERPHALGGDAGQLPECSVCNRSGDGLSLTPTVPYFLFVTAPTNRSSTADYSQTVQVTHARLAITSGKGRA